tara:strand:- start:12 stop:584 length:573 start_codon:yes stop_codon:yes gene_type:complete
MNENTNNWWEKQQDETNANEEGLEQVEETTQETTEDSVEEVTSEEADAPESVETEESIVEELVIEEPAEAVSSEENFDTVVTGDPDVVNKVGAFLNNWGVACKLIPSTERLDSSLTGKRIVVCGDDANQLMSACEISNDALHTVIHVGEENFSACAAGLEVGCENILLNGNSVSATLDNSKNQVLLRKYF